MNFQDSRAAGRRGAENRVACRVGGLRRWEGADAALMAGYSACAFLLYSLLPTVRVMKVCLVLNL